MDIQTSILVNFEIGNRAEKLEKNIDLLNYPDRNLGNQFIEFKEHCKVTIKLSSNSLISQLEIEGYDVESYNVLNPGDEVTISPGGDLDNMLVPGYYSIRVKSNNIWYEGYYKVVPSSMEWDGLINLRKNLESVISGLSYNIYAERQGNTGGEIITKDIHVFEVFRYIERNWNNIFTNLEYICRNPIVDIEKKYSKREYSKKQDSKSQRWLLKYDKQKDSGNLGKSLFFEKHCYLTDNIKENYVLKNILGEFYDILNNLTIQYSMIKTDLHEKIEILESEKNELQKQLTFSSNLFNVDKAKSDYSSLIKSKVKNIEEYRESLNSINQYCSKAKMYKGVISYFRNETFLKYVDYDSRYSRPSNNFLRNKNYNQIYNIYRELKNMKIEGVNRNMFPHKKTSKLFEIYSFIIIKNIFEEMGFRWTRGWLKSVDNVLSCSGDLLQGDIVVLEKGNYKIELVFDKEYRTSNSVIGSEESQLFATGNSRRPDITVLVYENNRLLRGLIVEVKCRRKNYLYMDGISTDVMNQLEDYYNFKYYDGQKKQVDIKSEAITKIIVIYPKQSGPCKFNAGIYRFPFIQINPADLGEEIYGYDELKEEIEEFLYN